MKRFKKIAASLLSVAMILGLAACGSSSNSKKATTSETDNQKDTKAIVVYFSATGNTEAVAKYIADDLNADTF